MKSIYPSVKYGTFPILHHLSRRIDEQDYNISEICFNILNHSRNNFTHIFTHTSFQFQYTLAMSVTSNDLDIEKMLTNVTIKEKLLKTVKSLIGFENVEAYIEPGSKRGTFYLFRTDC